MPSERIRGVEKSRSQTGFARSRKIVASYGFELIWLTEFSMSSLHSRTRKLHRLKRLDLKDSSHAECSFHPA